ncbi:hypothetical protein [Mannheimia indoligenes]|uniref:hypothetical protein n=1 Tax=Mannheimia indoligenes TaxID=3103145 RepID=UPI002FE546CF
MSKPFELGQALAGQYVKIKGTEEPRRIVGKSHFRNEYIIEDEYSAYRLSLESIQDGFEMWGEPNLRIQLNLPCPVLQLEVGKLYYTINVYDVDCYDGDMDFTSIEEWVYEDADDCQTKSRAEQGLMFASRTDAQEWLNAMRNSRR